MKISVTTQAIIISHALASYIQIIANIQALFSNAIDNEIVFLIKPNDNAMQINPGVWTQDS